MVCDFLYRTCESILFYSLSPSFFCRLGEVVVFFLLSIRFLPVSLYPVRYFIEIKGFSLCCNQGHLHLTRGDSYGAMWCDLRPAASCTRQEHVFSFLTLTRTDSSVCSSCATRLMVAGSLCGRTGWRIHFPERKGDPGQPLFISVLIQRGIRRIAVSFPLCVRFILTRSHGLECWGECALGKATAI